MLGEYKINRCTRQCFALQRPLKEGEWYYSVIVENGDDFERRDYSVEGWTEPPEDAVGWWKKQMPKADEKKLVLAPPEVLVDLLRQMEQFPARAKSRYLLALMLMRKRMIRPVPTVPNESDVDDGTSSESGILPQTMIVEVIADGSRIEIPTASIGKSESETLRDELNDLLYCEAVEEEELESGQDGGGDQGYTEQDSDKEDADAGS